VAAVLIRLKLRLLANRLRGDVWQVLTTVLAYLVAGAAALLGLALAMVLRTMDGPTAGILVVLVGSVLVLAWATVPLLSFGVDETLDPARFVVFPLRDRDLVPGLLGAGVVGAPGLATAVVCAGSVVTWWRGPLPVLVAAVSAVVALLTCVTVSRLVTTAASGMLSGRRGREWVAGASVLFLALVWLGPAAADRFIGGRDSVESLAGVLGWTPLGLAWAAPVDAANGDPGLALVRLLAAVVVLVAGAWLWARLLRRALERPSSGSRAGSVRGGWVHRLPEGRTWAVTGRSLRYWRRDPRYVTLIMTMVVAFSLPATVLFGELEDVRELLVAAGPYLGMLLGVVAANDAGYDGSAFATHLLTGVPGRADRTGRVVALLAWAGPLIVVITGVGCWLGGHPDLFPGAVGAALAALFGGAGAGSLAGALAPHPMPAAGANPFRSSSGVGAATVLVQMVVMGVATVAAAPAVVLLVVGATVWFPAVWVGLVVGTAAGVAVLLGGLAVAGRVVDRRGPEILAAVRRGD
jgi:ABC-2 type transport system permease protein